MARKSRPPLPPSRRGYNIYEVVSALQKSIRRSKVDDAIYWGAELYASGFPDWAWKRLRVIVSEDIGPAAPVGFVSDVRALEENDRHPDGKSGGGLMYFVHAVAICAMCKKSRLNDWAMFSVASGDRAPDREVPDYALDMHTVRGKQMGRGAGHFVKEAGKLVQPEWGPGGDADIKKLEAEYREVFMEDQSRWRDPIEPEAGEEPEAKPKPKRSKKTQQRLLP